MSRVWTFMQLRGVLLLSALSITAAACGGVPTGPFGQESWERSAPPADATMFHAWLEREPESLGDALELAYLLEAAGDPMRAADVLGDATLTGTALEEAVRALRLHALSARVPSFEDRVASWLERPQHAEEGHLLAWVLWLELRALAQWRAHRWSMAPGLPELWQAGVPQSWVMLGPHHPWDALAGDPMDVELDTPWLHAPAADASGSALRHVATRLPSMPLPIDEPAVWWLESAMEVDATSRWLFALASSATVSLYINEVLVHAGDPEERMDRGTQARWVELEPGVHRIRARVAHHGQPSSLWFRAFSPDAQTLLRWGAPGVEPPLPPDGAVRLGARVDLSPGPPPRTDGLARWAWSEWTALMGGLSTRLQLVEGRRDATDPVLAGLAARSLDHLALLEPDDRLASALTWLEEAETSWTAGLRLQRAELLLDAGRTRAAMDLLEELVLERPLHPAVHDAHGRAWQALRAPELAERAWQRAWQLFPTHCGIVTRWARVRLQRGEALREDTMPEAWLACDVGHEIALLSSLRPEGAWAEALDRAERLALREPWLATRLEAWLDAAWSAPDATALGRWEAYAGAWSEDRSVALRSQLDRALLQGEGAAIDAAVDAIHRWAPAEPVVLLIAALLGGAPERLRAMRPVAAQRRAWEEAGRPGETPLVMLLESSDTRWEEGGHRSVLRHQMIAVTSREGLEWVGELGLPADGAELLRLAVHKPDGRVRVPSADGQRRAVSMPDLEIGDIVEMAWLQRAPTLLAGSIAQEVAPMVLGSDEWALFETSASFSWPASLDGELVWDVRGLPWQEPSVDATGRRHVSWSVQALEPATPEPFTVGVRDRLPSVRVGLQLDADLRRRIESNRIRRATAVDDALRAEAAQWSPLRRREEARLRALFRAVVDQVRSDYGHFDATASAQWRAREGDRLAILVLLLRAAGWSPQVVFVNSTEAGSVGGPLVDVTAWDHTVIRVQGQEGVWWLDPLDEDAPFAYLRPELRDRPAWIVEGPDAGDVIRTPAFRLVEEERRMLVEATWHPERGWEGVLHDEIPARLGPAWRSWLRGVGDERSLRQELERELVDTFPGVEVVRVTVEGLEEPDAILRIAAEFRVPTPAPDEGRVALQVLPRAVGRAYASLSERQTPLVHFAMIERATLRLSLPRGWRWQAAERDEVAGSWGGRRVRVENGGTTLVWQRELRIPAGRVEPADYPAFSSAMRTLQDLARLEAVAFQP